MKILPRLPLHILVIVSTGFFFSSVVYAQDPKPPGVGLGRPVVAGRIPGATNTGMLRSCQARERGLKKRSTQLVRLTNNMFLKFDNIATRVQKYYTNVVLPSGKSVPNYAILVADIQTKKSIVKVDLAKVQSDLASFSCVSGNPKAAMTQFRVDMQIVKSALKDFRTSVKNLIVAVHSVAGERMSPKPTQLPGGGK